MSFIFHQHLFQKSTVPLKTSLRTMLINLRILRAKENDYLNQQEDEIPNNACGNIKPTSIFLYGVKLVGLFKRVNCRFIIAITRAKHLITSKRSGERILKIEFRCKPRKFWRWVLISLWRSVHLVPLTCIIHALFVTF
ncbi:unnamed protein product [Mucor hiemalis]